MLNAEKRHTNTKKKEAENGATNKTKTKNRQ